MENHANQTLPSWRLNFLRDQGFTSQNDELLSEMAFGIRFAYRSCWAIIVIGVATANIPILTTMMSLAFLGVILPNHPFDYVYNGWVADRMNRPRVPVRDARLKFACTVATLWLGVTIALFGFGMTMAGYWVGAALLVAVTSVAFFDFCVPSVIFNWFKKPVLDY